MPFPSFPPSRRIPGGVRSPALFTIASHVAAVALFAGTPFGHVSAQSRSAAASTQSRAADAQARELFDQGVVFFQAAQYERALTAFRAAYELSPRPQLLYNVGLAEDRLRNDERALEAFEGFLAGTPATEPRRAEVERRVVALRTSLEERRRLEAQAIEASRAAAEAQAAAVASAEAARNAAASHGGRDDVPLRRKWWLWTTVGVVVAAAIVVPIAVSRSGDPEQRYAPGSVGGVTFARWGGR